MMRKILTTLGAFAVGALGFALQAQAAPIDGSQSKVENSCVSPLPFFVGANCSYDGSRPIVGFAGSHWIGPNGGPAYYNPGKAPALGDDATGQARLAIGGDLVVSGAGDGATISGTITIGAGSRTWSCSQADECNEGWDSVTHTLAATTVDSAVMNAAGGYDYEIASKGVPPLLKPCVSYTIGPFGIFPAGPFGCSSSIEVDPGDPTATPPIPPTYGKGGFNFANQLFPSVTPSIAYAGSAWQGLGAIVGNGAGTEWSGGGPIDGNVSIVTFEGPQGCLFPWPPGFPDFLKTKDNCNSIFGPGSWAADANIGATTTAVATGYTCIDSGAGQCAAGSSTSGLGLGGTFGYENLIMAVSTNAAGGIIAINAYGVQEYCTLGGGPPFNIACPESWDAGTFEASGFVATSKGGAGNSDIQIDRKNILPVTILGSAELDVNSIDPASLQLGPGEFYTAETLGGLKHPNGHIGDTNGDNIDDFTGHFPSEDADLRCGLNQVKLRGTSDGVPFVTSVEVNGIGKACR